MDLRWLPDPFHGILISQMSSMSINAKNHCTIYIGGVVNSNYYTALAQQMRFWQGVNYNPCPLLSLSPRIPCKQFIPTTLITWPEMKILTLNYQGMIIWVLFDDLWNLTSLGLT